jgi:hypothetical protein
MFLLTVRLFDSKPDSEMCSACSVRRINSRHVIVTKWSEGSDQGSLADEILGTFHFSRGRAWRLDETRIDTLCATHSILVA